MEHLLLQTLKTLIPSLSDPTSHRRLQTLTLARSLIINPNSSPQTLDSVIDSLLQALNLHKNDPTLVRHVIKLLTDASSLTPCAIPAVRSLLDCGDPHTSAAAALAALDSIVLDEETVMALASSPSVSARARVVDFLVNSPSMSPETAVRILVGLSRDMYPSVSRAAADGMVKLLKRISFWVGN